MRNDPMGRTDDAVDDAVATARNMKDDASNVATNLQAAVDRSVSDQPLTTLALAIVAGFILGAVWKA
ncbi:MAG: hypothetical protein Q7T86_00805 [Hyphomicrobiaceae bacterium]|jgi:ElaB/YqjD/DUF883 family membrane-anchored ribosome-binding protein|nr:hypothetical protein [Hyphomicrobiaceae bacterium]